MASQVNGFFFELLQISLGNRKSFSYSPTLSQWSLIYDESQRQAVAGVLLHGLDKLSKEQLPPQELLYQWIGDSQIIEQRNSLMNSGCKRLIVKMEEAGLRATILKGQGVAQLYDDDLKLLRQPGDIDVFVDCGMSKTFEFARSLGQNSLDWDYKNLHLTIYDDVDVEIHYRVEVLLNQIKNRRLQKWIKMHINDLFGSEFVYDEKRITVPTIQFNVFYILLHIYRHFLYEGVGFRQIIDYYFVLKEYNAFSISSEEREVDINELLKMLGMTRFSSGLMWLMRSCLGMPEEWMICEADEKEGNYILYQVMEGGNFGHYDNRLNHGRGKLSVVRAIFLHNIHLLNHYPADVFWVPIWFVWHKLWKILQKIRGLKGSRDGSLIRFK